MPVFEVRTKQSVKGHPSLILLKDQVLLFQHVFATVIEDFGRAPQFRLWFIENDSRRLKTVGTFEVAGLLP